MRKNLLSLTALIFYAVALQAQYGGPRLFLDVPSIYFAAPDVENFSHQIGVGGEIAMNVASHWGTIRGGGGAVFSLDPQSNELKESFNTTPYGMIMLGAGKYRSNGNRCAKTKANAYTAMVTGGARYSFFTGDARDLADKTGQLDYTLGVELGYFYIRDIFKNFEISLRADYLTKSEVISASFGFKVFLNLRADRD